MIKPADEAGACLIVFDVLHRFGFSVSVSREAVIRALGVARSYAYEQARRLRELLERNGVAAEPPSSARDADLARLGVESAVLRYRLEHPGCWIDGGRTVYSDDLRAFVLALAARETDGERMTQEAFALACGIPLPTLKPWWRSAAAPSLSDTAGTTETPAAAAAPTSRVPAETGSGSDDAGALPPAPVVELAAAALAGPPPAALAALAPADAQAVDALDADGAAREAAAADDEAAHRPGGVGAADKAPPPAEPSPTAGFTLHMQRIIEQWERWHGTFDAFVRQHLPTLGIRHGKQIVSQLLHLAAARKLLRRPPPAPAARGSTFLPPPGVQWSSDGKDVVVVVGGEHFTVAWQPMVDVGSTATVGSTARPNEDTAGVIASFTEGVQTTGAAPAALLLDNKAPNKSAALAAALPDGTFVMHGTPGRGQSKATIEGGFGLFAQDLGPVAAVIDTASPEHIALSVADAVTRAYAAGRNRRPRRKDGKTPYELYRDADPSPEEVVAAVARLRAIKDRIDARAAREAARRDPYVRATLEDAFARFGFADEGDLLASLCTLSLPAVQSAIAIYAAKCAAGSLPADAGLRYFAGIARNRQHEIELQLYETELVSLLEREEQLVTAHLERKAAGLAPLDLAPRLGAIVHELLTVPVPVAQVFWRRRFEAAAVAVREHVRAPLRRWLCQRIRRFFRATKQVRQQLLDLVIRVLRPDPLPAPRAN
jgi:hypothetical protein